MRKIFKIALCFLVGLVGPAIVMGFFEYTDPQMLTRIASAELWTQIFALGIGLSLCVQLAISFYFHLGGDYESTCLPQPLDFVERVLFPMLMTFCVTASVGNLFKPDPSKHIHPTLGYLFFIALWDFLESYLAHPRPGHEERAQGFKHHCRQLFWHIDLPAFAVVMVWAVFVIQWWEPRQGDDGRFLTQTHLNVIQQSHEREQLAPVQQAEHAERNSSLMKRLKEQSRSLGEPLLGGVIGFHMLLTGLLLVIHLCEWETLPNAGNRATRRSPGTGAAPAIS